MVELLVVIGLIALLIALLTPTLGAAREHAKAVQCLSNLRQLATAAQAYVGENKGRYPIAYFTIARPPVFETRDWDFATIRDISSGQTRVEPGTLWRGRTDSRIQQCPGYDGRSNTAADPFTGYNYNTSYIGHGEYESAPTPARAAQVRNAAGCALFGDGEYAAGANKFMRAPLPNPGDANFNDRQAGAQGYRHRGRTNVVYCDGHAESLGKPRFVAGRFGFLSPDNSMYDLE